MATAPATYGVGNSRLLRQESVCKAAPFKGVVALKGGVKAILTLAVFANDNSGLVVADLDDIGFGSGHGFCIAGVNAGIL